MQQDSDGISLFAGRAPGGPCSNGATRGLVIKESGYDLLFKHLKGFRVTEKIGHTNQQVPKQRLYLDGRLLQVLDVIVNRIDLVNGHAPLNPAVDRAGLVLGKIVPGLGTQQNKDFFQRVLVERRRDGGRPGRSAKRMGHISHELGRHFGRCELVIHHAGVQGAARHAVKFAGVGILHHDHATLGLYGPHAQSSVATGTGEHDTNRPLALVLRQGAEQKVNRQAMAARRGGLQQLECAV